MAFSLLNLQCKINHKDHNVKVILHPYSSCVWHCMFCDLKSRTSGNTNATQEAGLKPTTSTESTTTPRDAKFLLSSTNKAK